MTANTTGNAHNAAVEMEAFRNSLRDSEIYPSNLLHKTTFPPTLQAYEKRLREQSVLLFAPESKAFVAFRDLKADRQVFHNEHIFNDRDLQLWLGFETNTDTTTGNRVVKPDPQCRFVFISSNSHSRDTLKITRQMLQRLLSFHQVMHNVLDFLSVFGVQERPRDIRFSSFRGESLISRPSSDLAIHSLGRTGHQFQMCYNLKCVALPDSLRPTTWSVRQATIYHRFDVGSGENGDGKAFWMITDGHWSIKDRIISMTNKQGRPRDRAFGTMPDAFGSSLSVHLLVCEWSVENWRWYLQYLEGAVEHETDLWIYLPNKAIEAGDLSKVQQYEEQASQVVMLLEANTNVLRSLKQFYTTLIRNEAFPRKDDCQESVISFEDQLDGLVKDSELQVTRAKLLVNSTSNRKALIQQHLENQKSVRMEIYTESMYNFSAMAQRESIAMRVIAFVTLVYLPATFVSTFFSTDVVKYQSADGTSQGSYSSVAMKRWIQITLPLTMITFAIAGVFFLRADKTRKLELTKLRLPGKIKLAEKLPGWE